MSDTGSTAQCSLVFGALLVAALGALSSACIPDAHATPAAALLALQSMPASTGAWAESIDFDIVCDTIAAVIAPTTAESDATTMAISCWVDGTTPVFFGGASTVTTALGIPICEDAACANGPSPALYRAPMSKRSVFGCITTAAPITIRCNAVSP